MTTSPDTLERIVAELRDRFRSGNSVPVQRAYLTREEFDRLEKLSAASVQVTDGFNGDNAKLVECIHALLAMDASGSMVPHGVGGHARALLTAAAARLPV